MIKNSKIRRTKKRVSKYSKKKRGAINGKSIKRKIYKKKSFKKHKKQIGGGRCPTCREVEPHWLIQSRGTRSECPICREEKDNQVVLKCGHMFCRDCARQMNFSEPPRGQPRAQVDRDAADAAANAAADRNAADAAANAAAVRNAANAVTRNAPPLVLGRVHAGPRGALPVVVGTPVSAPRAQPRAPAPPQPPQPQQPNIICPNTNREHNFQLTGLRGGDTALFTCADCSMLVDEDDPIYRQIEANKRRREEERSARLQRRCARTGGHRWRQTAANYARDIIWERCTKCGIERFR